MVFISYRVWELCLAQMLFGFEISLYTTSTFDLSVYLFQHCAVNFDRFDDSWFLLLAGMPRHENAKHFICSSNKVSALQMHTLES